MTTDLSLRVMVASLAAVVPLAALATWLGGVPAGLGLLAAGALTVVNFLALTRSLGAAGQWSPDRRPWLGWALSATARFAIVAVALATLLATGWAHPLALVTGLTVLPCALVAAGLSGARRRSEDC